MPQPEHPVDAATDKTIRELEAKKLALQAQIVALKAQVFQIDHDLFKAGATAERISHLMRW